MESLINESKMTDDQITDIWNGISAKNTIFAKRLNGGKGHPVIVTLEKWKTSDRVIKGKQGRMGALKALKNSDGKISWYIEEYNVTFTNNSTLKDRYPITNDSAKRLLTALDMKNAYKDLEENPNSQTLPDFKTVKEYIKEGVDFSKYLTSIGDEK